MKHAKTLLLIDAIINLLLGVILLAYSKPVVEFFGLPITGQFFYPNILGAILFGIGIALVIEYKRKGRFTGLGLAGAMSINMIGGIVLLLWLVFGNLALPLRGKVILWTLDILLIVLSSFELITSLRKK
jgi:hypothetical protein